MNETKPDAKQLYKLGHDLHYKHGQLGIAYGIYEMLIQSQPDTDSAQYAKEQLADLDKNHPGVRADFEKAAPIFNSGIIPNELHRSPQPAMYPAALHNPQTLPLAPGKRFLQVSGILFVLFGVLGLIFALIGITQAHYWNLVMPTSSGMSWSVYYSISMLTTAIYIIIGIMGIAYCARPDQADFCYQLGFIAIMVAFCSIVFAFGSGALAALGLGGVTTVLFALDFVLPILYIIGALKNT